MLLTATDVFARAEHTCKDLICWEWLTPEIVRSRLHAGAGILLRSYSGAELLGSAPWLLGSLGTVALDMAIFVQVR